MIDGLTPYPAYKDSGVPWLGQVPAHWEMRRLRNAVEMRVSNIDKHTKEGELPIRLCNYVDVYRNDRITDRASFMQATAMPEEIERFRLERGDVLITKDSEAWNDIGVPALVEYTAEDLVCGYHLALLRPCNGLLEGTYLLRALQSPTVTYQFHVAANGVTRYGLAHDAIKSVLAPIPPLPEQAAIVRFLDHADRRIRRSIRAKQQLIALLNEQKQAIIHRAVTRGLDPTVRLKPSGVAWLGEVPEHWEVPRLGRLIQLTTGFPFKSEGFSQHEDDVRLLRGINIAPGRVRWDAVVRWPADQYSNFSDFELHEGDIVLGMDRPIISSGVRVARIGAADVPSLVLQRVARIRPHADIDTEFLLLLLGGKSFADYLAPIFTGISVPHISPEQIGSFRIGLPNFAEQLQIVNWLKSSTSELNASIEAANREIILLREYRTRLIADVVTGKLDVRAAAARLPDESEEPEPLDEAGALAEGEEEAGEAELDAALEEADA